MKDVESYHPHMWINQSPQKLNNLPIIPLLRFSTKSSYYLCIFKKLCYFKDLLFFFFCLFCKRSEKLPRVVGKKENLSRLPSIGKDKWTGAVRGHNRSTEPEQMEAQMDHWITWGERWETRLERQARSQWAWCILLGEVIREGGFSGQIPQKHVLRQGCRCKWFIKE